MDNFKNGEGSKVQHNKPLLKMLFNQICSDILLIVGPNKVAFPAHKNVHTANSEFFKNMFDHDESPFKFPDAEPTPFRLFLMYVYSNDFDDLLKEPEIGTISTALEVLKYAKVYFVEPLVDLLIDHIYDMITTENVLSSICAYDQLDLEEGKMELYEFTRWNFLKVTKSQEWKRLPRKAVQDFIDDSEITDNEVGIFKALKRWGKAQCSNNSSNRGKTNDLELRKVLKGLVELIRYKRMSPKDFATQIVPLKILTVEQEHKILLELTVSNNSNDNARDQQSESKYTLHCDNCEYGLVPYCNNCGSDFKKPKIEEPIITRATDNRIL